MYVWDLFLGGSGGPVLGRVIFAFMSNPTGHLGFYGLPDGPFWVLWTTRRVIFCFMDYPMGHFWFYGGPE